MVQKPRFRRTRFGGDGVAVEFGGGGCGRRGDEGGVEMVVWPRWRRVAWWWRLRGDDDGGGVSAGGPGDDDEGDEVAA
ncbi:hypothetical protein Tco_0796413 [Tanacetum coccineum]